MWVRPCFAETPAWQDGVAVFRHGGDYNLGAILKTHYPAADENPPLGKRRFVHIQKDTGVHVSRFDEQPYRRMAAGFWLPREVGHD